MLGVLEADMTKTERLISYGKQLRELRENLGIDAKVLAARIGTTPQVLSNTEKAYQRDGRPPVMPNAEFISGVARELGWRVIDQRHLLGEIPDDEIEYVPDPDFSIVREAYDNGDASDRDYLRETARRIRRIHNALEACHEGSIGRRPDGQQK